MIVEQTKNRYIVIPPWSGEEIPWNPFNSSDLPVPDCAYLSRVFVSMEKDYAIAGLTFYITSNLDRLPSYGEDVVAVVLSDEWCRIPRYVLEVQAIFKTYGTALAINWAALTHPSPYEFAALAQDVRTKLRSIPYLLTFAGKYTQKAIRGKRPKWSIYDIPLGYFRQVAVPFVAIEKRRFDVYFAGSITNRSSSSHLLRRLTPKFISRDRMLRRLRHVSKKHTQLSITTALTAGFMQTNDDEATCYSKTMMQTKICIVPRGTSLETYRYFEGMRFGCVVICERLPRRWFYDGAPALRVGSWSELDRLIPDLLANPERLESLSRASLAWWSERCSEEAVGAYVARRVRGRPTRTAPASVDSLGNS